MQISRITESIEKFGDRFTQRLFTSGEIQYASAELGLKSERFAARFAAKEATIKAFSLSQSGINLRDIEVWKYQDGSCALMLHGKAAEAVKLLNVTDIALSLSHDGDYASAVVTAISSVTTPETYSLSLKPHERLIPN